MVAALVPIAVNRYSLHDHPLWLACAALALAVWASLLFSLGRTSGFRTINRSPEPLDRLFPLVGLPLHITIAGSLALIVLGLLPGVEEALYVTALTAGVIFAGYTLLACVLSQQHQAG